MFEVYIPTGLAETKLKFPSPRLDTLDGKVLGLLDNGKWNSKKLLNEVQDILIKNYNIKDVIKWKKPNFSAPANRDMREEIAKKCDFVVSAIGD
ncbi:hypothetical protein J2Z37_000999 [Ammoniphilus resinae]|uniref:UGSC-like domain-containing protein n=3 Tax=Ammoniphilus resinae TaxID=861532 RepID=A0ABS4GLJ0_9BACL|nr:hypothetical protein [Ammoniphilus resinae]